MIREAIKLTKNEGFFSKLKNKMRWSAADIGEYKHYYIDGQKAGLKARITIVNFDKGEDYVKFETEDIMSGKKATTETTITAWYQMKDKSAGWLEYTDDEQGRAFEFIKSQYSKDTSCTLRAGTDYLLDDSKKTTGKDKTFTVKKQKFNKALSLTRYEGITTDGQEIAFDPTQIVKG